VPQAGRARSAWCIVVDPEEAPRSENGAETVTDASARVERQPTLSTITSRYAAAHPDALFLVLPRAGRAAGYARRVAQDVCRAAGPTRTAWAWSLDDNLVRFQKWVSDPRTGRRAEAPEVDHPRFLEALLYAQALPDVAAYAQVGFLRQRGFGRRGTHGRKPRHKRASSHACPATRVEGTYTPGTAVNVTLTHATDVMSTYKCLLLHHRALDAKGVLYNPCVKRFEDICFTHGLLDAGLRTLKLYAYSYTAANLSFGGCAALRFDQSGAAREGPGARRGVPRGLESRPLQARRPPAVARRRRGARGQGAAHARPGGGDHDDCRVGAGLGEPRAGFRRR